MPTALIIGSAGQDGTLLSKFLREKGYTLALTDARPADAGTVELNALDSAAVRSAMFRWHPEEVYYLAAYHGSSEHSDPPLGESVERSFTVNTIGLNNVLAVALDLRATRIFYAASSRIFGHSAHPPQSELTPLQPDDPYGLAKAAGVHLCRLYRAQGIYASAGILFNHESPLRAQSFVSRKIVRAAVAISRGLQRELVLGSLDHRSDWGAAEDYVAAMWATLQLEKPSEFIIASGVTHTVRDWVRVAFNEVGLDWHRYVSEDPSLIGDAGASTVWCGDSSKLMKATGWQPTTDFEALVRSMVAAEEGACPAANEPPTSR